MKILFICGSLESGRDGVGDYSRRLAAECMRQGVDCRIVAINDRHLLSTEPLLEFQKDGEAVVECLRLASTLPWSQRTEIAREWRESYSPNILSLQFVPYSFQRKGLPFGLARRLKQVGDRTPWHIMFHELWINSLSPFSLLPRLQRKLVHSLTSTLNPIRLHTSNTQYQGQLKEFPIAVLNLFGNLPFSSTPSFRPRASVDRLRAISFGTLSDDIPGFKKQVEFIVRASLKQGKKAEFVLAGQSCQKLDHKCIIKSLLGDDSIVDVGPQDASHLSNLFQHCDLGVSRATARLFPKSGSTVALLEHGLPVVLRGPTEHTSDLNLSIYRKQLFFCDSDCDLLKKTPMRSSLPDCARMFIESLSKS